MKSLAGGNSHHFGIAQLALIVVGCFNQVGLDLWLRQKAAIRCKLLAFANLIGSLGPMADGGWLLRSGAN
jgi:hypothetical protein